MVTCFAPGTNPGVQVRPGTLPKRQYAVGAARIGASEAQARYFAEHVDADAVHEQVAAHDLCGSYVRQHPRRDRRRTVRAACSLAMDNYFAEHLLTKWSPIATRAA
jgi:Iron-containing redox enzyme